MEPDTKKCSSKKHQELNAVSFCSICKLYMCNKCENLHSDLFENHPLIKISKDFSEISSLYCQEKGHSSKLRYYCKNHNKLCCAFCICKIRDDDNGQHSNCNVCVINDIKDEKKSKLKENITQLEEISKGINESINKIKIIYEQMNEKKEELKLIVQKTFTNIRNAINTREDELLLEIDNKYNDKSIKEELIKEIERLPNKIKASLEKCKSINKEWDNNDKLFSIINNCINIENILKDINKINQVIKNFDSNIKPNIAFYPKEEKEINLFLSKIKSFGKITEDDLFNLCEISKILDNNENYSNALKNWINPKENIKYELLYRLSENGESFSKFHELCDNKGPLLVLFHVQDGNKIGLYTPLILDQNKKGWQNDMETFLFNLNQNKKYKKIENSCSLYYDNNFGVFTAYFGNHGENKTMRQLKHFANSINFYYENGSRILPSQNQEKNYDLLEVEVFKVSKIN